MKEQTTPMERPLRTTTAQTGPDKSATELMRGLVDVPFAVAILRRLADLLEQGKVRVIAFDNNVYEVLHHGTVSVKWEEMK